MKKELMDLIYGSNEIYIFGAGENGKELLKYLAKIVKVTAFIDNDEKKHGKLIGEIECISVKEAIKRGAQKELVLISSDKFEGIEQQLNELSFLRTFYVAPYIGKIRHFVKYFIPSILEDSDYNAVVPFNHYESPYPDIVEIHQKEERLFDKTKEVLGLDFNIDRQLELLKRMEYVDLLEWTEKKEKMDIAIFIIMVGLVREVPMRCVI